MFPEAEDALYLFVGSPPSLKLSEIRTKLSSLSLPNERTVQLIEMLLWFGFLGVANADNMESEGIFIYDVQYDIKKLRVLGENLSDESVVFCIHPAFYPFLEIPKQQVA